MRIKTGIKSKKKRHHFVDEKKKQDLQIRNAEIQV